MNKRDLIHIVKKAYLFEFKALAEETIDPYSSVGLFYRKFRTFLEKNGFKDITSAEFLEWFKRNQSAFEAINTSYDTFFLKDDKLSSEVRYGKGKYPRMGLQFSIISLSPLDKDSPDFDILSESFLTGMGSIPQLRLYSILNYYKNPEADFSKEMSHFGTILSGISHTFSVFKSDDVKRVYESIKPKLEALRPYFQQTPKKLGAGMDGIAFDIGGGKILKIFRSERAYREAIKSMDRLYKRPELAKTEAMIYDVGVLGSLRGKDPLYYWIMEKMPVTLENIDNFDLETLNGLITIITRVYDDMPHPMKLDISSNIEDPAQKEKVTQFIKDATKYVVTELNRHPYFAKENRLKKFETNHKLSPGWLETFAEEIIFKLMSGRVDLHEGNVGITNYGQLRFFDPVI